MVMLSEHRTESGTMILNMGPQHPSTHGVLRLLIELDGETVLNCMPDVGFLHTGIEKTMEARNYHQAIVLTDRTDYLSPPSNNLSYILSCEKLFGVEKEIPERAQIVRVIFCELARIASHLIWLGTHALDLGATTVFMYCWREREKILSIYETVSGVRMMTSYFRIGGLAADVPDDVADMVEGVVKDMPRRIDDYETLLTKNPIFLDRTQGVGVMSRENALKYGLTGPCLRGSGVPFDIRKVYPYSGYDAYDFDVPYSNEGDVYARYMVRMREMRESVRIVSQAAKRLRETKGAPVKIDNPRVIFPKREKIHRSMESLIHHFKLVSEGPVPPAGEAYAAIESPRGEQATYVFSDGSNKPHRVRFRAPGWFNLQALPNMINDGLVADVVACIGSIDIVLGEIDR
ncbi:MAG TPA: NADH dehydrogenase (quinone) subunit D [Chloroflexota bacterium]|nr:NADH dehydrogenase (quinone) subunit D [Chloroflexota bacterium]